jgi:transposase InsO family protein
VYAEIRREIPKVDGVYVKGDIQDVDVVYTIDTGASISLISSRVFNEIPSRDRPAVSDKVPTIHNADGKPIPCKGVAAFRMMLGPLYLEKSLIIADITDDVLLGADVLLGDESGRADMLFSKNIIILKGIEIPIETDGYPNKVRRARLVDNYVVPPMSEIIADVFIDRAEVESQIDFLIEPSELFADKYKLAMAPSLVDIRDRVTQPVRIMNPFLTPAVLQQDSVIGTACPVEMVETIVECENEGEVEDNTSIRQIQLRKVDQDKIAGDKVLATKEELDGIMDDIPEHLNELFRKSAEEKTLTQVKALAEFLTRNADVFSTHDLDLGLTHLTEHAIETGDGSPIKSAPRRIPLAFIDEADEAVQKFFDQGVARDSTSPWSSPLVFVRKKNGQVRPCVDYRRLNNITKKDAFPLPRAQDCFDTVAGATLFSSMDITSAYNQIPIRVQDIPKTAFVTKHGLFEFTTMPFGLCNAPATFQRVMELALAGLQWKTCLVYLDDVLVFSTTFEEHIQRLADVLDRIRLANLKLKPAKCNFLQSEVPYLGHILSAEGVRPNNENIEKILSWRRPTTVKEVRSFLGIANYYRRFIVGFSYYVKPLIDLTKTGTTFKWTDACEEGFNHVKFVLLSPAIMAHPQRTGLFILDTDASDVNIGAVLSQVQNDAVKVIAYGSKTLSKAERNYCVTDRELLAIRYFTEYHRCYLLGRKFLIRTDHQALKWLLNLKQPKNRIARWIEALSEFDFTVEHRAGVKHGNADALSRCPNPWECTCKLFESLRCGPCKKCLRKTELMEGTLPEVVSHVEEGEEVQVEMNSRCGNMEAAVNSISKIGCTSSSCVAFWMVISVSLVFGMTAWATGPQVVVEGIMGLLAVLFLCMSCEMTLNVDRVPKFRSCSSWSQFFYPVELFYQVAHLCNGLTKPAVGSATGKSRKAFLEVTSDDGRTRPKKAGVTTTLGRGSLCKVRVTKQDLRNSWPLKTSVKDVKQQQIADPHIGPVYKWFQAGKRPYGPEVQSASPATRHYWLHWDSLTLKNDILHRWFHRKDGTEYLQALVPNSLKKDVLCQMHDGLLSGHLGNKKTRDKILQRFYWFGVRGDTDCYVQSCDTCTSIKGPRQYPKAPLGNMQTGAPLDRLSTDILGPLPESHRHNKYVLVVTDHFSRWVEIFAVPDQTAVTCAEKILDEVIARYGCPYDLHSDQGRNYMSNIFVELCQMLEIRKTRSSPYNPRCNGQVERFNRTLIKMIKAYMKGQQKDWDKHLGCLAGAYRATVHESTGVTPNLLMLGREVRLPAQLMYSAPTNGSEFISYSDYVEKLKERMEHAHELARKNLGKSVKRQKEHYDAKLMLHSYKAGELVWYASGSSELHIAPKLRKFYTGPVVVLKKISDLNYLIQTDAKRTQKVVHHNKLFPYKGDQKPKWIKVACKILK